MLGSQKGNILPKTMDEGFRSFISKLTPTAIEGASAKSHRASIEACLKSNFQMSRFFRTGSFGNGTSISGYSDVDYFAEIPTPRLHNQSNITLNRVKNVLAIRFPNTGVRVATPTVLVPFGFLKSESTEVAPCSHVITSQGFKVYEIANGSNGWMRSCPDAHNQYVRLIDQKHGGKVKRLIRLIKAWKYYRSVPISSFYLELHVAKFCDTETSIIYRYDIKTILLKLHSSGLARLRDPVGFSGYVSPCQTQVQHDVAMSKLATAVVRSEKALESVESGNIRDAFGWYNRLYDGNFVSYY